MFDYSFFDKTTGYFSFHVISPEENYLNYPQPSWAHGVVGDYSSGDHFYQDGEIIPIQRMQLQYSGSVVADGVSTWACTGVPVGATVKWPDGAITTETDGSIEFVTDVVGRHAFEIMCAPYKTEVIKIEAITN